MASHHLISRYNPLRRYHRDGTTMTALPPISRTNIHDECQEIKEDETQKRHRRLTSIKDFVKKQRRHKHRGSAPHRDCEKTGEDNSSTVVQAIRPSSAGSQTSSSTRSKRYASRRGGQTRGEDMLKALEPSGSKRMSYPPSEFHRQELVSTSFARLRRDNSRSCPMLCDVAMYEFDIDDEVGVLYHRQNSGDNIAVNNHEIENGIDKFKTSDRTNGDRFRVKQKSKNSVNSKKDESASARPPKPPSWQNIQTSPQQNLTEPEVKIQHKSSHSSEMLKKIGRSKSEETGTQRTSDSLNYRLFKPPSWQTISTQGGSLDEDGITESTARWTGYAKSEGAGLNKQLETNSYKPPKPPSWQTVAAEPDDVTIETKPTANNVPTITIPSNSSGRCASAGSSRSTRTPCKIQVDEDVENDSNLPETVQASASNKSRGLRRSNIKRTRSRMIDAHEIPAQDSVIPLSQTKPSEFHLRETHHDNDVYLSENVERCRLWLAGLLGDRGDTLTRTTASSQRGAAAKEADWDDDDDELVTCELEMARDKWMYVGSPYPSSSSEDEDI